MGLVIRKRDNDAGDVQRFGDEVKEVVFGRDPALCQVVFPADMTVVGREHCALRREVGTYRLEVRGDHLVTLDGKTAMDGEEVPEQCELQLGPDGPTLILKRTGAQAGALPPTMHQGRRAGEATIVRSVAGASRRNRSYVLGVLCLLVVAAVVGFVALRTQERKATELAGSLVDRLAGVEETVGGLQDDLGHVRDDLQSVGGDVGNLQSSVTATIDSLTDRFSDVESQVEALGPQMKERLRALQPSVYLVIMEIDGQRELGAGTAWVVDRGRGLLATNAHVAAIFEELQGAVSAGTVQTARLLVRSNEEEPRTYVVGQVTLHPGYRAFETLWRGYLPVATNAKTAELVQFINACDVGLLHLERPWDGLASALEIAGDETLQGLDAGDPIAYVGYPMEGVAYGGSPVAKPTPQMQIGSITTVTDHFGTRGHSAEARAGHDLVQHNCLAAGGASGSPMFDSAGRVVALLCAGNALQFGTGEPRVLTGGGLTYAQRSDLIRELVTGQADALQPTRTAAWKETIKRLYPSGWELSRDDAVTTALVGTTQLLEGQSGMRVAYELKLVSEQHVVAAAEGARSVDVAGWPVDPGEYLLIADAERALPIELLGSFDDSKGMTTALTSGNVSPAVARCQIDTPIPGALRFTAECLEEDDVGVRCQLYRARTTTMTPVMLRQRLVAAWLMNLETQQGGEWTAGVASSGTATLDAKGTWRSRPQLLQGGEYLISGISPGGERVDLLLFNAGSGQLIAEDRADDHYPTCGFSLEAPLEVEIVVVGPTRGTQAELFILRAVAQGGP
jgi:hypothetical protein